LRHRVAGGVVVQTENDQIGLLGAMLSSATPGSAASTRRWRICKPVVPASPSMKMFVMMDDVQWL